MDSIIFFIVVLIVIVCIVIVMNKKVIQRFTENCGVTSCTFSQEAPSTSLGNYSFPKTELVYEGSICFGNEVKISKDFDKFIEEHPKINRVLINLVIDDTTVIEVQEYIYKITLIPNEGETLNNEELQLVRDKVIINFSKSEENMLEGSSPSITFNDCQEEQEDSAVPAPGGTGGGAGTGAQAPGGTGGVTGIIGAPAPGGTGGGAGTGGVTGIIGAPAPGGTGTGGVTGTEPVCTFDMLNPTNPECFTGNIELNPKQVVQICSKSYCGDACMTHNILYNTPQVSCDEDNTKTCFQFKEGQITPEELRQCDSWSFRTKNICANLQCKFDKCYENTNYITLSANPGKTLAPETVKKICDDLYCEDTNSPSYVEYNNNYSRKKRELCETLKCEPYNPNQPYQETDWEKCNPYMNELWNKIDEMRKKPEYREQHNYDSPAGCESLPNYQDSNGCEPFTGSIQENFQNVPCASDDTILGGDSDGSEVNCSNFNTVCEDGETLDGYQVIHDNITFLSDKDPEKVCPKCGNCDRGEDNSPAIEPETINILTDGNFEDITDQDKTIITTLINGNYSSISTGVIFENQNNKVLIKINLKSDTSYQQAYGEMTKIINRRQIPTSRSPLNIVSVTTTLEAPAPAPATPTPASAPAPAAPTPASAPAPAAPTPASAPAPAEEHQNMIVVKFDKSCDNLTQSDITKIKTNISNLLNIPINRIRVSCGSIKVVIVLPNEITQSRLRKMLNTLLNKRFNIRLNSGVVLERLSHVSHTVKNFKNELTYSGPVSSDSCEDSSDLKEFTDFMKAFGGVPEGANDRKGKNIVQYQPEGPANIFSPFLQVS